MHTFALFCYSSSSASAREGEKKKRNEEEEEKNPKERERYLRGRRVAMIYENRSIETRLLYVVMLLIG
jgi:ornithine carbamoyltransferase